MANIKRVEIKLSKFYKATENNEIKLKKYINERYYTDHKRIGK